MDEKIRFIYKEECWYISALVNTRKIDPDEKIPEIEHILETKLGNLTEDDLKRIKWNEELLKQVMELGKNIDLKLDWVPFFEFFPYYDENVGLRYNTLGFFQIDVEYYKDDPKKKESITPPQIQQIPGVVLNTLKEYCGQYENQYFCIDRESPIFVFVTSDTIKDSQNKKIEVEWTQENIMKYKKMLGSWTEIYSGQWPDYSESLYNKRVQNNLSNRVSELHFIRRNSGFIYMAEENYKRFFNTYMKGAVLHPTAQVRSMIFALISINESLDALFSMKDYMFLQTLEQKIEDLRNTRGLIDTKMSLIYKELDYNRRQHYTSVLIHLIDEFNLNSILERIHNKFDVIHDSMQVRYQSANAENQARVERGMNYLNILFAVAVLAEVMTFILSTTHPISLVFSSSAFIIISIILLLVCKSLLSTQRALKAKVRKAVDTVIFDDTKENVVLIKRKYPPCKNQWALPGGFIEKGETAEQAALREAEEETGLILKIEGKIGFYDDPDRDPRGRVVSTAFACSIPGDDVIKVSDEAKEVKFIPLKELKGVDLAFDHEFILRDAVKKFLGKWPNT
ncbi:MAG: NUDIX domain-containing protein [Promethearchaeota archaeon]